MSDYFEKAEGKKFLDLIEDVSVQRDLVNFFKSKRYNYSDDELKSMTPEEVGNMFVDHMRWQEVNEATVVRDINFVNRSKKEGDEEALDSFGRLMMAWDSSEGAGTGFLDGAADYAQAIAVAPSTLATVATAGIGGPVSKFAGGAAKKAGQMTLRKLLTDRFVKESAKRVMKDKAAVEAAKGSLTKAAASGFMRGAAIEGSIEGGSEFGRQEIREETVEGYDKNMALVAAAAGISGALGGTLGAVARTASVNRQNKAIDLLAKQAVLAKRQDLTALKEVNKKLNKKSKTKPKEFEQLKKRTDSLIQLLAKQEQGRLRDFKKPLDAAQVESGKQVAEDILKGADGEIVTARYTSGTFKKIAAATLELKDRLKFDLSDDVRISQKVADALRDGKIDSESLTAVRTQYGMTKDEFSLMFLADMSEAGRTLNLASQMKKGFEKTVKTARKDIQEVVNNLDKFASEGLTNAADDAVLKLAQSVSSTGKGAQALELARELDSFRIGMMTTQLATTAANVATGVARIPMDMSNRVFLNVLEGRMPLNNVTSVIKGLSWGSNEARLARLSATMDNTSNTARIFQGVTRIENDMGSNSILAKTARGFNFMNSVTDSVFKEAVFYGALQRQIADLGDKKLGRTYKEYLKKNVGLDALPKEVVEKARREALSFSFQYGYEGAQDLFGKGARGLIRLNRDLPFVVSAGFGIPFPRFIANQMEFMHRYLPTGLAQGLWETASGKGSKDALVSSKEKIAQGLTGSMMLLGAVGFRMQADEGTTYREGIDRVSGDVIDMSRAGGPLMAHFFLGDVISRQIKGLPLNKSFQDLGGEAFEILSGLNAYGYSNNVVKELVRSGELGEPTEALSKWAGDIVATLTMPLATVRDIQAQFNQEAAASPYTRRVEPEGDVFTSQFMQRALRFIPDFNWVQFASSFNGKNDIPLYSGFNSEPVQKVNPISSQLTGFDTRPKRNELQNEMVRLNLKEWKMLSSTRIKNPSVDLAVKEQLSKTLPQEFESWRENMKFTSADISYDDLEPTAQKKVLEEFIKSRVRDRTEKTEALFQKFASENPRQAVGFIMNNYSIQKRLFEREFGDIGRVLRYGGLDKSEKEYLNEVDKPAAIASRMQKILQLMEMYKADFEN